VSEFASRKQGSATDPLWYKDAVIYELHVKAFADGNGDGIGDFQGLMEKLDYLQALGVTCIWLLPFFPSPGRDDGYDISDYMSVNPNYGTVQDFQLFLEAAHARDMQVMIELVINHTSDQHPWFQQARLAPPGSPERDMYVWSETDKLYSGVRIIFTDTEKSNWTWDETAQAYYWHRFFSHQPDLNFDHPRVLEEVLNAMRFWMDMGVDGLRLDAIPYLVERDGTSCENVPETHVIIKKIRAAIDAEYDNRLILAEANMWPADVRPYFGDGDECQMAFHFPLMPRIYMALRQEDRLPITEIMAQTPAIPDSCQWGLFLRNHDELTLEMVTDDERDYMYLAYSGDPRMRINVGIRRRLAPLLDNNRRRIELLNSLLFSFPGTPILYYGDEIGMGDNIYLGDRNGVRTPMQWNSDRNAGFSRAVPAALYSPVIMDPIWGYQAINVEAQEQDTSSLLHWTRNMIALRKLFQVFGRGTQEFLKPENRKVLAYVREYNGERVVCVANLSRFAQPVTLDLSRWEGMVPVEMLGYVPFPPIDKSPYAITLGPYAFLWLELQDAPKAAETLPSAPPEIVIPASDIAGVLSGPGLELLQEAVLPKYMARQRWFGAKTRTIQSVTVADWVLLPVEDAAILLVDVVYVEGPGERYTMPVAVRFDETVVDDRFCLTKVRGGSDAGSVAPSVAGANLHEGILVDALSIQAVRDAVLALVENDEMLPTQHGTLQGLRGSAVKTADGLVSRLTSAEQSNSSVLYGDQLILKMFRRIEEGVNPDVELGRFLTEETGFTHTAAFAGEIAYTVEGRDDEPTKRYTLGLLQAQVKNVGDGWEWTQAELARIGQVQQPGMAEFASYVAAARLLAERTAEMHRALASGTSAEIAPEQPTSTKLVADAARLREQVTRTLSTLKHKFVDLPEDLEEMAASLLSKRSAMEEVVQRFEKLPATEAGLWTRIHGDYHLGQILRTENDFALLDFEGEPAKSLVERRKRQSPLRDVAGMLRSFSYAGAAFAHEHNEAAGWVALWEAEVRKEFLSAYEAASGGRLSASRRVMLQAYLLEKAMYELQYELDSRPTWAHIPLGGILRLLGIAG
jgi:maltose alpha-D-glucosyltransferase / alpha-amylase